MGRVATSAKLRGLHCATCPIQDSPKPDSASSSGSLIGLCRRFNSSGLRTCLLYTSDAADDM
eukprot:7898658-Prorocentrum_lima.AAC.1